MMMADADGPFELKTAALGVVAGPVVAPANQVVAEGAVGDARESVRSEGPT